ncbi:MAG: NIL domain-containing protein [Actinobacteria bacterium]|nr:NIL domain-containing protein [Actinomycetota bacterium]MCL6104881.1 NIL domain-containing protein [Actinomycetota bacterium]
MTSVVLRVKLIFPEKLIREPIIARLVKEHNVVPNIRRASVEGTEGWIICELSGTTDAIEESLKWLRELGISVDLLGDMVES